MNRHPDPLGVRAGSFRELGPDGSGLRVGPLQVDRRSRLPNFYCATEDTTARMASLRVCVVGAGSVGLNLILHLARLAVDTLWIVDPGRYKVESLITHPLEPSMIGEPKATAAGRQAKLLSPTTRIMVSDGKLEQLPEEALEEADVILLASDNLAAEVEAGQRCLHLQKPLFQASVHGESLVAQVRFFAGDTRRGDGPCPACQFGKEEWIQLQQETIYSCSGESIIEAPASGQAGGLGDAAIAHPTAQPTVSTSFLCSLAADLLMTRLIGRLFAGGNGSGSGAGASGNGEEGEEREEREEGVESDESSVLEYSGFNHRVTVSSLKRNLDCPCDHVAWQRRSGPADLADSTLAELLAATGFPEEDAPDSAAGVPLETLETLSVTISDHHYAERGMCGCDSGHDLSRFIADVPALATTVVSTVPTTVVGTLVGTGEAGCCARCGRPIRVTPYYTRRDVPAELLRAVLDRPLRDLGVEAPRSLLVRSGERVVQFRPAGSDATEET